MTFPVDLTTFTVPGAPTDGLNAPNHATVHSEIVDALQRLESTIGVRTSTDASTLFGKIGTGTKNFIVNGGATIAQAGNPKVIDGWGFKSNYLVTSAVVSQQPFTPGSEAPTVAGDYSEAGDRSFARYHTTASSGPSDYAYIGFPVEDVRTLAGKQATFSFYAKTGLASTVSVIGVQTFGDTGSSPVLVRTTSSGGFDTPVATTTSWARYSFTMTFPSITGKTLGVGDRVVILLYLQSVTASAQGAVPADYFDIWGVQLEAGPVATRFQRKSYTETLLECSKYYAIVKSGFMGAASTSSVAVFQSPVPMLYRVGETPLGIAAASITPLGSDKIIQVLAAAPTPVTVVIPTTLTYHTAQMTAGNNLIVYASGLSGLTVGQPLLWIGSAFGVDYFPVSPYF